MALLSPSRPHHGATRARPSKVSTNLTIASKSPIIKLPKSNISRKTKNLEERVGMTPLTRTTRASHLTEAGRLYFEKAALALKEPAVAEEMPCDLFLIFGLEAPMNGRWISLPSLYPEERPIAITKSQQI